MKTPYDKVRESHSFRILKLSPLMLREEILSPRARGQQRGLVHVEGPEAREEVQRHAHRREEREVEVRQDHRGRHAVVPADVLVYETPLHETPYTDTVPQGRPYI